MKSTGQGACLNVVLTVPFNIIFYNQMILLQIYDQAYEGAPRNGLYLCNINGKEYSDKCRMFV